MIGEDHARALRSRALGVLAANWREGVHPDGTAYGFTCPSPPRYRHQWYWDSCFHAIVWRQFDPRRAREELRTLLRSGALDGFIPHTVFWHDAAGLAAGPVLRDALAARAIGHGAHPDAADRARLGGGRRRLGRRPRVRDRVARRAARSTTTGSTAHRDPDGDGLISIIHPDESGLDDSPKYDEVFGWMSHYLPGYMLAGRALAPARLRLALDHRTLRRARRGRARQHVLRALAALARTAERRARVRAAGVPRTEQALLDRCWDARRGLFWDLAGRDHRPLVRRPGPRSPRSRSPRCLRTSPRA